LLGGVPLRGNFGAVGFIYDEENDVFYSSQPYDSWILNKKIEESEKYNKPDIPFAEKIQFENNKLAELEEKLNQI
jgi:hypothetical protein